MSKAYSIPFELLTDNQIDNITKEVNDEADIALDDLTEDQIDYLLNNGYVRCEDCGDIISEEDAYLVYYTDHMIGCRYDGQKYVCENCIDDYYYCEDSEEYYTEDLMETIDYGTRNEMFVARCSNAFEMATRCDECDRYYSDDYIYISGNRAVCEDCYDRYGYATCASCGDLLSEDEYIYDDYTGECYCECCYDNYVDHHQGITGYHHDNEQDKLTFNKMPEEDTDLYMGVELEVESKDGCYPSLDSVADDIHDLCEDLIIKEDGSLDRGFEMVTQPCTIGYHLNRIPWAEICREALDSDMLSDKAKNCGLHVHVSRKALGSTEEAQDLTIAKMLILFDRFETQIENFARRKSDRWAAFYKTEGKDIERDMYYTLKNKVGTGDSARYHAINLTNLHTVEFRAFKGSLNVETVKATIQFVYTFVNFAIKADLITVQNCEWQDICKDTEFTELRAYLNRRHLD